MKNIGDRSPEFFRIPHQGVAGWCRVFSAARASCKSFTCNDTTPKGWARSPVEFLPWPSTLAHRLLLIIPYKPLPARSSPLRVSSFRFLYFSLLHANIRTAGLEGQANERTVTLPGKILSWGRGQRCYLSTRSFSEGERYHKKSVISAAAPITHHIKISKNCCRSSADRPKSAHQLMPIIGPIIPNQLAERYCAA